MFVLGKCGRKTEAINCNLNISSVQNATAPLICTFDGRFECTFFFLSLLQLGFLQKSILILSIILNRREGCAEFPFSVYEVFSAFGTEVKVGRYFDRKQAIG